MINGIINGVLNGIINGMINGMVKGLLNKEFPLSIFSVSPCFPLFSLVGHVGW